MATWNQNINSGGFLGGIGQVNSNAPQARDINPTLGLIRENNDLQRSGANNWGLQGLAGLSGVAQVMDQQKKQERLTEFQGKWGQAMTSNDTNAMRGLFAEYPEMREQITGGMDGINDDVKQSFGNIALGYSSAISSGNPEEYVRQNADEFRRLGIDPQEALKKAIDSPAEAKQFAISLGMRAVTPERFMDMVDADANRVIKRDELAESARSNRADEALKDKQINVSRANALTSAYAPTSAMQNYSQYAQMLKTDPEGAKAFAQSAGIDSASKKLMKVEKNDDGSVTKYYTDGSEEVGKLNQPISGDGINSISLPQAQKIIDKAPEGSKKAAGFALRLKDSMDSMNKLGETIDPKRIALINNALGDGTVANISLSPAEQQYMVNARDALYAILRPETGAAITLPEMQEYSKMYLPQPGDSKQATDTKMRKMQGQYNSLKGQSGRVYDALVVSSAANEQPSTQQSIPPQQAQQSPSQAASEKTPLADGATATNPNTGQKMIFRGGKWQKI